MKEYERIKLRIRRTGLSFKEFAARADIIYNHLGMYLNGFRRLQKGDMDRLTSTLSALESAPAVPA